VRVARPTDRFDDVVAFYRDALGLEEIGGFTDHDGYDGAFLGTPCHLEITHHADGSPGVAPDPENLLVLYLGSGDAVAEVVTRLATHGHHPVDAENPYWAGTGAVTVADPDGWRVVLVPSTGLGWLGLGVAGGRGGPVPDPPGRA
jgi:catechol 2,3-dioxygenase-like lactoylglutathione lyase family enzyme